MDTNQNSKVGTHDIQHVALIVFQGCVDSIALGTDNGGGCFVTSSRELDFGAVMPNAEILARHIEDNASLPGNMGVSVWPKNCGKKIYTSKKMHPDSIVICIWNDTYIYAFLRVSMKGGSPVHLLFPERGINGSTLVIEAFAWGGASGRDTISMLGRDLIEDLLCRVPCGEESIKLFAMGLVDAFSSPPLTLALTTIKKRGCVLLSMDLSGDDWENASNEIVSGGAFGGFLVALFHSRGTLSPKSRDLWLAEGGFPIFSTEEEDNESPIAPKGPETSIIQAPLHARERHYVRQKDLKILKSLPPSIQGLRPSSVTGARVSVSVFKGVMGGLGIRSVQ